MAVAHDAVANSWGFVIVIFEDAGINQEPIHLASLGLADSSQELGWGCSELNPVFLGEFDVGYLNVMRRAGCVRCELHHESHLSKLAMPSFPARPICKSTLDYFGKPCGTSPGI